MEPPFQNSSLRQYGIARALDQVYNDRSKCMISLAGILLIIFTPLFLFSNNAPYYNTAAVTRIQTPKTSYHNSTAPSNQIPTWQPFNDTNPHNNTWCPSSTTQCHNSPLCTPCNRRHLIILATGRSGSTTLLQMLNLLPNVRLSGENANAIFEASRIVSSIKHQTGNKAGKNSLLDQNFDRTEGAWMHNAIPKQNMACVMQRILYALNPPPLKVQQLRQSRQSLEEYDRHTILGMKTIRFHRGSWNPAQSAKFLQYHFPCSRIIVNVRSDVQSQLSSMKGTFKNEDETHNNESSIQMMNDFLIEVDNILPDDYSRLIDMNEWTKDVNILNDLVKWMGFEDCEFQEVGHENYNGYGRDEKLIENANGDSGRQNNIFSSEKCRYPHALER